MTSEMPADVQRITVNLIPAAVQAVHRSTSAEGVSKTDVVNRAVSLYDYVRGRLAAGDELLFRRQDGTSEAVKLI